MDRSRTFGIVAHIDAGKTTLTERILHDSGSRPMVGSVDEGTAAMDWLPEERSRGISIAAAATRVPWAGHELQVVDTPGHVDFTAEVERCLHVLDGVVVVVDAVRGVESQTEVVWQQAAGRGLPRLCFVNKLDRDGADFAAVVRDLAERFEVQALPLVLPWFDRERRFAGLADAVTGAVQWFADRPPDAEQAAALRRALQAAHDRLVDAAGMADEAVLALVVAGQPVPPAQLRAVLRRETLAGRLVPVLAGAALWNRGVDWLLDGVIAFLPGLADRLGQGLWAAAGAGDPAAPFAGLVFKVQHGAELWNFVRVVRGQLRAGDRVVRHRLPDDELAVAALGTVQADRLREAAVAGPGEIVVLPGLAGLRTGDTLHAPGSPEQLPVPRFPAPVLSSVFEPATDADAAALWAALREQAADDPTLRVDRERGQIVVRGMGELHLEIVAERVRQRLGRDCHRSPVRVDRRETVRGSGRGEVEVRAMVAGAERAARCALQVTPLADRLAAPQVGAAEGLPAAAAAALGEVVERLAAGGPAGPNTGLAVELVALSGDLEFEPLVQLAAARALDDALAAAGTVVLEPWVAVEVWCPEANSAPVLGDLLARGAEVQQVAAGRLGGRLQAAVPLRPMLGYVTRLRSLSRGLGQVSMRPLGYRPVASGGA